MGSSFVVIGILFTHVYGTSTIDKEFNRNVFHDDMEYTLIDPNYSQELLPNDQYFRQIRQFQEDYKMIDKIEEFYSNNWNPNREYDTRVENTILDGERMKRSTEGDKNLQVAVEIGKDMEKPLEIAVLELENVTETKAKESRAENKSRPKREKDSNDRQGKTLLEPSGEFETSREPRGATKEQWIKQPYPVLNPKPDDSATSNSDTVRAPRVHFVTQRRSESSPPPVYRSFDGDNREIIDYPRDYYHRPPRHYETYPPPPYRPNYYRPRYDYEPNNKYQDTERPVYNKQRRIIYYATLPEVVRTPPDVDLRDRYNYRDRFVSSAPLAVAGADPPYRYRKPYPTSKSRYDEIERGKSPYSLKVSTDVNVREIKKNPERRIYSEGDRRYPPPYRPDELSYGRRP